MFSVSELNNDYDFFESVKASEEELDLTFLEAIESAENIFGMDQKFFSSLQNLKPQKTLVPTLRESVFEAPVEHAVWNSEWPKSHRHFPA